MPNTMYAGFMTLYMLELGMSKAQVGFVTSLGLAVHLFFAIISAYVTDKLGRRYATLIFDMIGWGGTHLLWAFATNMNFFIAAAVVNAFMRIVMNSWTCLMIEDSEPEIRVHIFNFILIAGILAGFFAPVGALLVNKLTLVPAMRVMCLFGFVSMMTLFIVRHMMVTETAVGVQKMREMKGVSIWGVFKTYPPVIRRLVSDRLLAVVFLVRALNFIQFTVRGAFLAVLVTERLGFPAETMALFQTLSAVVMLLTLVFITPVLATYTRRWPIAMGIGFHIAATFILLLSPATQNYPLLILSGIFIALGTSVTSPRIDSLVANTIANEERSVINAAMGIILLLISTPFGYIGGVLSDIDPRLPFLLTLTVLLLCLLLLHVATRIEKRRDADKAMA